ncbi:MAG: hypothetical protein KF715_09295 [Candidatus Didemnitutus sp.]|nr:hypothetical protein [Candidatus Didemnitutus sp.]
MLRTPFQIVLGTHDTTPVPAAARAHGFTQRFALVQSTHASAVADMVIDSVALLALIRVLDAHCATPGSLFWDRPGRRRQRVELDALAAYYRDTAPENHDPLTAGEWRRGGRLVALLHTETWCNVGGPAPYHDSLTYSFYSATDLSGLLFDGLRRADLAPTSVITTTSAPPRRSRLALKDTLFLTSLAGLSLASLLFLGMQLLDPTSRAETSLDVAGPWIAGPLVLAFVYVTAYLIARRGRHPFTP